MPTFTIPFSQPFLPTLAQGILNRFGDNPLTLAKTIVLLPKRRGCLGLKAAFRHSQKFLNKKQPLILPRIIALADLEQTPHLPGFIPAPMPPSMPKIQQLGLLSQLILAYGKKNVPLSANKALQLAQDLLALLDEIHTSDINPSKLATLVDKEFAEHWKLTLDFLQIITEFWPKILKEKGFMDSAIRSRDNLRLIAQEWQPQGPVILAGTTATRPATTDLALAINKLSEGYIVLPGYMKEEDPHNLPPTHPQYTLHQFVHRLGILPAQITSWVDKEVEAKSSNISLFLKEVMSPSFETLSPPSSTEIEFPLPFRLIECQDTQEESETIATLIRKMLEGPKKTIAVITPDHELTQRLQAQLSRWNIVANSSAGVPLGQTVVGTFLTLIASIHPKMSVSTWLSLLKHPLFFKHENRGDHLKNTRLWDRKWRDLDVSKITSVFQDTSPVDEDLQEWYSQIQQLIAPITELSGRNILETWLSALIKTAEGLCAPPSLWAEADGTAAKEFIHEFSKYASDYPSLSAGQFSTLLPQLLDQQTVHVRRGIGSPVMILGALEARQVQADYIILAGLNEGTWPKGTQPDPWLNHPMRLALGLPDPQQHIGLSAHDFCMCFSAAMADTIPITLTRSLRSNGAPTLPSRWWLRLEAILEARKIPKPLDLEIIHLTYQLDQPEVISSISPPRPCPPQEKRPTQYTVTDIEQLMRDPYSYYAKRILQLKKLKELDHELEARDFGQLIHKILDRFHKRTAETGQSESLETLLACGQQIFKPLLGDPFVQYFWWPRFEQIAHWLIQNWNLRKVDKIMTEKECQMTLSLFPHPQSVGLKTIIDRIEFEGNEIIHILDYKTGTVPTQKDIVSGLSPQLPLEAIILNEANDTSFNISSLQYWHLKGGAEGGEIKDVKKPKDLIEQTRQGTQKLLAHFLGEESSYLCCPWGDTIAKNKDYHHLARVKEWNG